MDPPWDNNNHLGVRDLLVTGDLADQVVLEVQEEMEVQEDMEVQVVMEVLVVLDPTGTDHLSSVAPHQVWAGTTVANSNNRISTTRDNMVDLHPHLLQGGKVDLRGTGVDLPAGVTVPLLLSLLRLVTIPCLSGQPPTAAATNGRAAATVI